MKYTIEIQRIKALNLVESLLVYISEDEEEYKREQANLISMFIINKTYVESYVRSNQHAEHCYIVYDFCRQPR